MIEVFKFNFFLIEVFLRIYFCRKFGFKFLDFDMIEYFLFNVILKIWFWGNILINIYKSIYVWFFLIFKIEMYLILFCNGFLEYCFFFYDRSDFGMDIMELLFCL